MRRRKKNEREIERTKKKKSNIRCKGYVQKCCTFEKLPKYNTTQKSIVQKKQHRRMNEMNRSKTIF